MKRVLPIFVFSVLGLGLVLGLGYLIYERVLEIVREDEERPDRPAVVDLHEVEQRTLERRVNAVGTLRAHQRVDIAPEIAGRIASVHFRQGQHVHADDLLFQLDDRKLRHREQTQEAALSAAQVARRNAQQRFDRLSSLLERDIASQEEFDEASAELDQAIANVDQLEAELELVREELRDTGIRAPFDGVISEREFDPGAHVSADQTLATLYDTSSLQIRFAVPERHAAAIRAVDGFGEGDSPVSSRVHVSTATANGQAEGYVYYVSPSITEGTRQLWARARIPLDDESGCVAEGDAGHFRPGSFANVSLVTERREDRPTVPAEALISSREGYSIFVVEDGQAKLVPVSTGLREGGYVEILDNERGPAVSPGQQVVRRGHMNLDDGDAVRDAASEDAPVDDDATP